MKLIGNGAQVNGDSQQMFIGGSERGSLRFDVGKRCDRMRLKLAIPCKNTSGGNADLTQAHVLAIIREIMGTTSIKFGAGERHRWLTALDFNRLREYFVMMDEDDFTVLDSTGAIAEYTAVTSTHTGVANNATVTLTVEIPIPFAMARAAGEDRRKWCPGSTQMRACEIEVKRGTGFDAGSKVDAKWEQGGDVAALLFSDDHPGDDVWTFPPILAGRSVADQKKEPLPGGQLLALWDRTGLAAASSLNEYTIRALHDGGDVEIIHDGITPLDVARNADRDIEESRANLATLATILYRHPNDAPAHEAPYGRRFEFEQGRQTVVTTDLVALIAPLVEDEAEEAVAQHVTSEKGGNLPTVKLAKDVRSGGSPVAGVTAGIRIMRPGGTDYPAAVGVVVTRHSEGSISKRTEIPEAVRAAAQGATSQGKDRAEQQATARKVAVQVAAQLPGAVSVSRSTTKTANGSASVRKFADSVGGVVKDQIFNR